MRTISATLLVLGLLASFAMSDDKEKKRKPRFTIGKETTYVTGPVDADGYIDYAAALNERLGKGIKPQDNANVLLWKAFGPHPEGAKMPPDFFKWLGIDAPPERGDYFLNLTRFMREQLQVEPGSERAKGLYDQQDRAMQRPWTAKDYPEIAAWLRANEKPLALVIEATKRPHYFNPLVPTKNKKGSSGLVGALLPGVQKCREFASALTARAMLNVSQGRPDDAWQDLLACHRLGRLTARGGTLIEGLVGIAVDMVASKADLAFLDAAKPTEKQLRACLRDLQKLPPLPSTVDEVDLGERFLFLDIITHRGGIQFLEGLSGGAPPKVPDPKAERLLDDIDWDLVLRNANRWYDRMVAAMRVKDRPEREKKLSRIEEDLKGLKKSFTDRGSLAKLLLEKDTPKARGEVFADVLISQVVPAVRKVQEAHDRIEQAQANLHVAFALACYRSEHGRYPAKLDALAPKYLAKVPSDLFSGKALIYHPDKDGYLLYSVGVNGKDEQGRSYEDDPPGDDLAVRIPLPKLPRE
ncbi:MAG: hypothetical protein HYS12_27450 [Planctomycetes bacterium]|nr:hypothetical protein [Planctomycetota bacterium]